MCGPTVLDMVRVCRPRDPVEEQGRMTARRDRISTVRHRIALRPWSDQRPLPVGATRCDAVVEVGGDVSVGEVQVEPCLCFGLGGEVEQLRCRVLGQPGRGATSPRRSPGRHGPHSGRPAPPIRRSLPRSPDSLSLPAPPLITSLPAQITSSHARSIVHDLASITSRPCSPQHRRPRRGHGLVATDEAVDGRTIAAGPTAPPARKEERGRRMPRS